MILASQSFYLIIPRPPSSTLFPYTTLFRSFTGRRPERARLAVRNVRRKQELAASRREYLGIGIGRRRNEGQRSRRLDRKSTRLNSSHVEISYAVFCLKKKTKAYSDTAQRRS